MTIFGQKHQGGAEAGASTDISRKNRHSSGRFGRLLLRVWPVMAGVILLVLVAWWPTAETSTADGAEADTKQSAPESESKSAGEPEEQDTTAEPDGGVMGKSGGPVKGPAELLMSADQERLFALSDKFMRASEAGASEEELAVISAEIQAVMDKMTLEIETDPNARLQGPPAAGVGPGGNAGASKSISSPNEVRALRPRDLAGRGVGGVDANSAAADVSGGELDADLLLPGAEELEARLAEMEAEDGELAPDQEGVDATAGEPTDGGAEAQDDEEAAPSDEVKVVELAVASPNDVVKLDMKDDLLDINMLIDTIGRELKFSFLYDNTAGVAGQVKLQQYGEITRKDLLPLLESMLSFQKLTMVREDPFIRIVKRDESLLKTYPPMVIGPNTPDLEPGDQVISQIVEIKHVSIEDVKGLLGQFADATVMVQIPKTNHLIITEYARRMPRLLDMIELIDQPGPAKKLVPFELYHVTAKEIHGQLNELLKSLAEEGLLGPEEPVVQPGKSPPPKQPARPSRRTPKEAPAATIQPTARGPRVLLDERTDRFLVIGTDDQIDKVAELIGLLDVAVPGVEIKLVPFGMEYVSAEKVQPKVAELIKALAEEAAEAEGEAKPEAKPEPTRTRAARSVRSPKPVKGPFMLVDERTNRLFVVGTAEQIDQVNHLLGMLDIERPGPPLRLEPVQITHVAAGDVASQLADLFGALTEQDEEPTVQLERASQQTPALPKRTPQQQQRSRQTARLEDLTRTQGPYMLADERTNRLLIVGTDDQIGQLKDLLALLDIPPYEYDQAVIKVYRPRYVEAEEARKIMDQLGITKVDDLRPRDQARAMAAREQPSRTGQIDASDRSFIEEEFAIRLAVQESLNRIFILATEPQHEEIVSLMSHIDQDPNDDESPYQIYFLENRDPEVVAEMLTDLLESEKTDVKSEVRIPAKEGAPIIRALPEIYAVAVRGSQKQHDEIKSIIEQLDKRLPQVLVEAILVQVSTNDSLDLGVTLQDARSIGDQRFISGVSPFGIGGTSRSGNIVSGTGGILAYLDDALVYATLEALQQQGDSKIVSKPRILVNDNEEGNIVSTRGEPTTTTTIPAGSDTAITDFKEYVEAGTTLTITPHISEGDFLQLAINLQVDSFEGTGSGNVPPAKASNNITTLVNVPDNKTIVLGGLTTRRNAIEVDKVPLLGDIPILGAVFRSVSKTSTSALLYVFVKAHIVRSDTPETLEFEDLDELSEKYRQQLRQQEQDYKHQTIIPGIPDAEREPESSALDEG